MENNNSKSLIKNEQTQQDVVTAFITALTPQQHQNRTAIIASEPTKQLEVSSRKNLSESLAVFLPQEIGIMTKISQGENGIFNGGKNRMLLQAEWEELWSPIPEEEATDRMRAWQTYRKIRFNRNLIPKYLRYDNGQWYARKPFRVTSLLSETVLAILEADRDSDWKCDSLAELGTELIAGACKLNPEIQEELKKFCENNELADLLSSIQQEIDHMEDAETRDLILSSVHLEAMDVVRKKEKEMREIADKYNVEEMSEAKFSQLLDEACAVDSIDCEEKNGNNNIIKISDYLKK